MRACRWALSLAVIVLLGVAPGRAADVTIGGLAPSRSFRAFSGPDYDHLRSRLSDPARFGPGGVVPHSLQFVPDLDALGETSLSGLDVLVLSEVANDFGKPDAVEVAQFVRSGGSLLLITDTLHRSQPASGNGSTAITAILQELDGGEVSASANLTGIQSAQAGDILPVVSAVLDGPFGALEPSDHLSATFHNPLRPGSASQVLATRGGTPLLMEIRPGALGPESGGVLVAGDILFADFFLPPAEIGLLENENNAVVIENFMAQAALSIPEPGTWSLALLGALAAQAALLCGRRLRRSA